MKKVGSTQFYNDNEPFCIEDLKEFVENKQKNGATHLRVLTRVENGMTIVEGFEAINNSKIKKE